VLFGWRRNILIFLQPHCYLLVCLYTALLFVGLIESLDIVWEELALGGSKLKGRPSLQLALFCLYSQFSHILIVCFCEGSEIWWANVVPILLALWAVNPKQLKFLYLSNFRVRIIFFGICVFLTVSLWFFTWILSLLLISYFLRISIFYRQLMNLLLLLMVTQLVRGFIAWLVSHLSEYFGVVARVKCLVNSVFRCF